MRSLLPGALLLISCTPAVSQAPDAGQEAPAPTRVRVATFNVRRFFDSTCQSGACGPADFEVVLTPQAFEARAAQLAQALTSLEADVVALQEVENQACLDALLGRLAGVLPHGVLGETGAPGSVDVAVLSRAPLEQVLTHRPQERLTRPDGSTTTFTRELLEAHLRADDGTLVVLFAAHFRSKVNDDPGRRLAEAEATRRLLDARAAASPEALVLLGGDLNDTPGSPPLDALLAEPAPLLRAAADLPEAEQATYFFNGQGQALDHLFQAATGAGAVVPRSAVVWKDGRGYAGSDHAALSAVFELTPRAP